MRAGWRAVSPVVRAVRGRTESVRDLLPRRYRSTKAKSHSGTTVYKLLIYCCYGAGNGIRTRDFDLGKVALYH